MILQMVRKSGIVLFGISWIVIAWQHFLRADLLVELVPEYMPVRLFWVYLTGVGMLVAGVSLIFSRYVKFATAFLVLMLCLFIVQLHTPLLVEKINSNSRWTRALQDICIVGVTLVVMNNLKATKVGLYLYAIPMLYFGIGHFLNLNFVTVKVPESIPGKLFWDYATGIAMVSACLCILLSKYVSIATIALGAITLLFVLVKILMLFGDTENPIKWIMTMIELGIAAGAFIISGNFNRDSFEKNSI